MIPFCLQNELGTLECDGCPESSQRKKRASESNMVPSVIDMSRLSVCSMPMCIAQDMSCVC